MGSRACSRSSRALEVRRTKSVFGSSYANFVVMGSAASRKLVALRCPVFAIFVGGGYNGRIARTFAQRQQSQQRQQHQQNQQQSSHTLEARGTKRVFVWVLTIAQPAAEPAAGSRANNHSSQALLNPRDQKCAHGHGVATCVLDIVF